MAQAAPLQPGRGQATILRFLGDLSRLRAPGAPKRAASALVVGRVGRSVERLAQRIQTGAPSNMASTGVATAAGGAVPMRFFQPQALAPFAPSISTPPVQTINANEERLIPSAVAAQSDTPPLAPNALSGSLADRVQTRREVNISTVAPVSTSQTESAPAPKVVASVDGYPADLNLSLSRAPIPTVSWLGTAAPEPATPTPEPIAHRVGMPPASKPALPTLAPLFSSAPADAMIRPHGPSPLATSNIMRHAISPEPPPVAPPSVMDQGASNDGPSELAEAQTAAYSPIVDQPLAAPRTITREILVVDEGPGNIASEDRPTLTPPSMALPISSSPTENRAAFAGVAPSVETTVQRAMEPSSQPSEAMRADPPITHDIRIVDHVMRSLARPAPIGPLSRSPFLPLSLATLGNDERRTTAPGELAPALHTPSLSRQEFAYSDMDAVALAPPTLARSMATTQYQTSTAPIGLFAERLTLPPRAIMPAEQGPMDRRAAPEMPLPPRDRTAAAAASAGTLIQRSETGSDPSGAGGSAPSPSAPPEEAAHTPEPGGGGANEVNLLANEVWSLLKRRLAYESERMGR